MALNLKLSKEEIKELRIPDEDLLYIALALEIINDEEYMWLMKRTKKENKMDNNEIAVELTKIWYQEHSLLWKEDLLDIFEYFKEGLNRVEKESEND